ncbi:hypothetical protein ACLPHD_14190 [Serratia odorifera]|uniref:hypothetical protein n=1 Tax=Serratia odorifera TaxID=618 RepID=UPI003D28B18A
MDGLCKKLSIFVVALIIVGCDQSPPSFVVNANKLIEKRISAITHHNTFCSLSSDKNSWISICKVDHPNSSPIFSVQEIEGVMQASDNLSFTIRPQNKDAQFFYQHKEFAKR